MDDDAPEQGGVKSPPASVPIVVGNLGGGALVQEPMEKKTPWEDIAQSSDSGQKSERIAAKAWPGPAGVARNNRLILATVVFFVSMFFEWGFGFWVEWYWYAIEGYSAERMAELDLHLSGWAETSGVLEWIFSGFLVESFVYGFEALGLMYILFIARDFMPLVLIGVFVFGWIKRNSGQAVFHKIGVFSGGYFAVMAITLLYLSLIHI